MKQASKRSITIGVVAEEDNDIEVLYALTEKLIPTTWFRFKPIVGNGCGKLHRKLPGWSRVLRDRGCEALVVLRDTDRNDRATLEADLSSRLSSSPFSKQLVVLPREEIEAWLLFDVDAIYRTFTPKQKLPIPKDPEQVASPKEWLESFIFRSCGNRYLNTEHNGRIARHIDLSKLDACTAFQPYVAFIHGLLSKRQKHELQKMQASK